MILLQFFDKPKLHLITLKDFNNIILKIKTKHDYLSKSPNNLILLEREDFTNFTKF